MMKSMWRPAGLAAVWVLAIGALSGCGILDPIVCHNGIIYEAVPHQKTIAVGESFTVQVDATSGVVTGLQAGETEVRGLDEHGSVLVISRVNVQ
jgi:hypothetical protein